MNEDARCNSIMPRIWQRLVSRDFPFYALPYSETWSFSCIVCRLGYWALNCILNSVKMQLFNLQDQWAAEYHIGLAGSLIGSNLRPLKLKAILISHCFYQEKDTLQPDSMVKAQVPRCEFSKYTTITILESSALSTGWKPLMFQSLLMSNSKAYWPIFLSNLVRAMFI